MALLLGGPTEQDSAPASHASAARAAEAGEWAEALEASRRTLELDPDFAPGYRMLVDAAFAAGRAGEARELLERLDTQAPPRALPRVALATLQRRLGDLTAASRHGSSALEADRESLPALLEMAQIARAERRLPALAESFARAAAARPSSAELAYATAHVHELAFRFAEAEQWLERSQRLRRLPEQSLSRARMLLERGRRPECVAAADEGLALAQDRPQSEPVRIQILVTKSRCEFELGRRPDMRRSSEAALALAREAGDVSGLGDAWRAHGYAVEYPGRGPALQRAIAIHEAVRDGAKLAEDLVALSIFPGYPSTADVTRGLAERSLLLASQAGDVRTEIRARGTLGGNLLVRGELSTAMPHLLRNYEAAQRIGSARAEAVNAGNLAEALLSAGDLELAEEYILRSRSAYRRSDDPGGEALSLAGLGDLAYERRAYARALDLHRRAASLWAIAGHASGPLITKVALDYQALGDLRAARQHCREAIAATAAVGDRISAMRAELLLAEMDLSEGRHEEAARQLEHVLAAIVGEGYEPQIAILAHRALARALRSLGRAQQAHAQYRSALAWIEQLRAGIPLSSLRTLFFRERQGVYVEAVELLYEMHLRDPGAGHDREAFSLAEHARARVLLEAVNAGVPISPLAERVESQARLSRIEAALRDVSRPDARERLARLREIEEKRLANLELLQLKQEPSEQRSLRPPALLQVQQALPEQTLLLEFLLGAERSFVFVVSRDSLRFLALPARQRIDERVRAFRALASVHPAAAPQARLPRIAASGAALLQQLLGPASEALESHRELVIAPDGILFYLPFEALRRGPGAPALAETHTLRYTPSAALLVQPRAPVEASQSGATLVAFGDPKLSAAAASEPSLLRSIERGGFRLAPLPASRDEVRAIAGLFAPGESKLYLGEAFREPAVVLELSRAHRYVHFATHAVVDEQAPLRSGIVVSRAPGAGDEDGVLQVREIAGLRIAAELVTLSACQTGLGTLVDGEGMLGVARAFQQAGARSLVVSLWNVNDFSTGKFMATFYRFLQAGRPPALALALAKREMLRSPNPSLRHPYHWAGFVLIGG